MKTIFIRTLAITGLASSISASAASGESKREVPAAGCNAAQQETSTDNAKQSGHNSQQNTKQSDPKTKSNHPETQEDKDFDRVLMSIYG